MEDEELDQEFDEATVKTLCGNPSLKKMNVEDIMESTLKARKDLRHKHASYYFKRQEKFRDEVEEIRKKLQHDLKEFAWAASVVVMKKTGTRSVLKETKFALS